MTLAGWLLVWIATPIALWMAGAEVFPLLASLGVLAQLFASISALRLSWPARRILWTGLFVIVFTWLVEVVGVRWAFPFGRYSYTSSLQPQWGGVPALIPLAWMMMLAPAWGIAQAILGGLRERLRGWYWIAFSTLAGAAFTAWDLYLDPQMVSRGLWLWEGTYTWSYFGIPLSNYLGWWSTAALITLIVRPADLPMIPLLLIYTLTWAFQAVGLGIFWGQPGVALAGLVGMGAWTALAWWKIWRETGQ